MSMVEMAMVGLQVATLVVSKELSVLEVAATTVQRLSAATT
jgi:hypothetical protein